MNRALDASAKAKTVDKAALNQNFVEIARLTKEEIQGYDAEPRKLEIK